MSQEIQENQYRFPYHYIPTLTRNTFKHYVLFNWSVNYLTAVNEVVRYSMKFDNILEIGCGDGRILHEIRKAYPYKTLTGIDYSSQAISLAKVFNEGISFYQLDVTEVNVQELISADLILLIEVFEHIPLDMAFDFANAIARIQNKGQRLLITVPHENASLEDKQKQHFSFESLFKYFEGIYDLEQVRFIQKTNIWVRLFFKIFYSKFFIWPNKIQFWAYNFYYKNYFNANESNCTRIWMELKRK